MILDLIDSEMKNKVSANFIKFIKEEKDNNYKPNINPELPLEEQNILPETIDILALLKLNYWCNEEEKKELLKVIYTINKFNAVIKMEVCHEEKKQKKNTI